MNLTENSLIYLLMVALSPFLGFFINLLFFKKNPIKGARVATLTVWIGFINSLLAWAIELPFSEKNQSWGFLANEISWLMATLILFVSAIVHHFSLRYMAGDRNFRRYFLFLGLVTISTLLLVASDHLVLLILFWSFSNLMLVLLMMHKIQWTAAKNSGIVAIKAFLIGFLFLILGTGLLAHAAGTLSLHVITENSDGLSAWSRVIALLFILMAAFSQSGGWPFHGWLMSSLNSPTPVSAFMHAGLVNGGGLLLARFAPIFLQESLVLTLLFILAVITLILGGIWKLLQSDIKRMLACSTMTQMGFMMMQCSLGLFAAALAHLCWHGLFKAFLFLRSGSTIAEKQRADEERLSTISSFFLSSICGLIGSIGFVLGSSLSIDFTRDLGDTTTILSLFAWMASTQLAHTMLAKKPSPFLVMIASGFCFAAGFLYGWTVNLIEKAVAPMGISQPQPLNSIHILGIAIIVCIWIALNLKLFSQYAGSIWWRRFYVRMLNASQPYPETTTSSRKGYKF
jgi:NAD(P)H-quinone oxidoreductase subunit 5